ncbi:low affinity iron permease family protein [Paraburkholderia sp. LEh10]|uniref:low affinity iron permease family protein n=1 Tax=Paraburkholderia sp. LEh10 TaxID=2821353 RepID=UPI002473DACC|nr:low affinity iron permease family protein [Paraburkholderia sp. LEh10]
MRSDRHAADRLESVPDTSSRAYAARHPVTRAVDRFASTVTRWPGSPVAFGVAVIAIVAWLIPGPLLGIHNTNDELEGA